MTRGARFLKGVIIMIEVGIKNLRSLLDVPNLQLKPITVLVGKNSSGKSSFLRILPLLKQTYETKKSEPLLWYGNYVDFGDFDESITRGRKSENISINFKIEVSLESISGFMNRHFFNSYYYLSEKERNIDTTVNISFNKERVTKIFISLENQNIYIEFGENSNILNYSINGDSFLEKNLKWIPSHLGIIPKIMFIDNSKVQDYTDGSIAKLTDKLMQYAYRTTKKDTIFEAIQQLSLGTKDDIYKHLSRNYRFPDYLRSKIHDMHITDKNFTEINNIIIQMFVPAILSACDEKL